MTASIGIFVLTGWFALDRTAFADLPADAELLQSAAWPPLPATQRVQRRGREQ
jgi:hypothetical protein